jgi:hypothetical protein
VFINSKVPVVIKEVPKPELLIWENIDFVNRSLDPFDIFLSRYLPTLSAFIALLIIHIISTAIIKEVLP